MSKLKKLTLTLGVAAVAYTVYSKLKELEKEGNYIKDCKEKILARGYEIKDSWCFNLPENNYLEITFTDFKGRDYTVVYSKVENEITSFREV